MTTSSADAPTRSQAELANAVCLGDTAEYVQKTLAKAPKLTEEQLGRLRDLSCNRGLPTPNRALFVNNLTRWQRALEHNPGDLSRNELWGVCVFVAMSFQA